MTPPESAAPRPPQKPARSVRRNRPVWPWWVLGGSLLLGTLVAYSPALLGGQILARFGQDLGLKVDRIDGPLWAPTLRGAVVKQPGVDITAGVAGVNVASVDPRTRTIRVNVRVNDASVKLRLAELMKSEEAAR